MATNSKDTFTERNPYLVYSDEFEDTKTDIMRTVGNMLEDTAITLSSEAVRAFDTVAEMQACTSLIVGMICHTNGFHASGDGGAAFYKITATGTANGMDVLACGDVFANLVITESYVTPEVFGAWGDDVHDDTAALARALTFCSVSLLAKTYIIEHLVISTSYRKITGIGATLNHGADTGIIVSAGTHDLNISGISFSGTYTPGSNEYTNGGIAISHSDLTALYESYNIVIDNCSFNGGVYGIAANSTMNLEIARCNFGSFVYKPVDSAGGYGVLTQSCKDVNIHDCYFKRGDYGRHDIYVSIAQNKTENIKSSNYVISNCIFDMSDTSTQESGVFYSPNTQCVNVRYIDDFKIENCLGIRVTGIVAFTAADGAIQNAIVENITSENPRYFSAEQAPYEIRSTVNLALNADDGTLRISNIKTVDPESVNYQDITVNGGTVHIENVIVTNRINVAKAKMLFVDSCVYDTGGLYYSGTDVLVGKITNVMPKTASDLTVISAVNDNVLHPSLFCAEHFGAYVIGNNGSIAGNTAKATVPYSYNLSDSKILRFAFPKLSAPIRLGIASSGVGSVPKIYTCDYDNTTPAVGVRVYDATGTELTSGSLASRISFLP